MQSLSFISQCVLIQLCHGFYFIPSVPMSLLDLLYILTQTDLPIDAIVVVVDIRSFFADGISQKVKLIHQNVQEFWAQNQNINSTIQSMLFATSMLPDKKIMFQAKIQMKVEVDFLLATASKT